MMMGSTREHQDLVHRALHGGRCSVILNRRQRISQHRTIDQFKHRHQDSCAYLWLPTIKSASNKQANVLLPLPSLHYLPRAFRFSQFLPRQVPPHLSRLRNSPIPNHTTTCPKLAPRCVSVLISILGYLISHTQAQSQFSYVGVHPQTPTPHPHNIVSTRCLVQP